MSSTRREFLQNLGWSMVGLAAAGSAAPAEAQTWQSMPTAPALGGHGPSAHFISRGPGFGRRIALTFDDGPNPPVTPIILEALRKRSIRATFFMIGQRVKAVPALAKQVLEEGHEIGNHSYTHPALSKLPDDRANWEIQTCQDTIIEATGYAPLWLRPPYGAFRHEQGSMALSRGMGVAYWTVDPRDWSQPGVERIVGTILKETTPGCVVLMHDLHKQTAQAIDQILDGLIEREFEFATISEFIGKPYETVV